MWLSDLRVVLPDRVLERGSLCIEGGRIVDIIEGPAAREDLRGDGLTALPGLIDMHGDMLEREISPRPGVEFPADLALLELDKRLAASGVTTAYAAVSFARWGDPKNVRSEERAYELVRTVNDLRGELLVAMNIHARFEVTNQHAAPSLRELLGAGHVQLVSLMDHTPGQGQYRDLERYVTFTAKWGSVDRAVVEQRVRQRIQQAQEAPPCWDVVSEVTCQAASRGIPVASHDDDTPAKVALVAGLRATISEFPVTLEAAQAAKDRGMYVAMGAPNVLLGRSHSGNLSGRDAIQAGLVDILASDYYPAAPLQAVFMIAREGLLSLERATQLVSSNPARALGLGERGRIAVDYRADLVLVENGLRRPRVRGTLRDGLPIYWDSMLSARQQRDRVVEMVGGSAYSL